MGTAPRFASAVVSLLLPLSLLSSGGSSYAAEPRHVDVVADELPAGPAPELAYVTGDRLVRPDGTSVDVGGPAFSPMRVHGGYLLAAHTPRGANRYYDDIVMVPDRGPTRLFLRKAASNSGFSIARATASRSGRLVAMLDGTWRTVSKAVVKRVSDGRTIAVRRNFHGELLAFQGRRVLVLLDAVRRTGRPHLVWWNVDSNRYSPVLTAPRGRVSRDWQGHGDYPFAGAAAASLLAGQVALPSGGREFVRRLPGRHGRTWLTEPGEYVQSWSPTGLTVLTAVDPGPFRMGGEVAPTATLRLRRAGSGAILAEFRGLMGVDTEFHRAPVWETANTFLTTAWSAYDADEDRPSVTGERTIRCRTDTVTCERVLPELDADLDPARFSTFAVPRNK